MRNEARVNAFSMIFEGLFHERDELLSKELLPPLKRAEDEEFCAQIMQEFEKHRDEMKEQIQSHLKNFTYDRVFKVDLALVFLALTEILYCKTPKAVAVNEAVELAKKYSTDKSSKFINGLVGSILQDK